MKKWTSLLILIALFAAFMVPTANAAGTALTVTSASGNVGDSVTVDVAVVGNVESGLGTGRITVTYPAELELTALEGVNFKGAVNVANGMANHTDAYPVVGDVVLLKATFKILDTAKAGTYTVTANAQNFRDNDGTRLDVANGSATITVTVPPCATHTWGEYTGTDATCTADGVKTATCSVCGAVDTKTTPATGHAWGEWTESKAPSCTAKGEETRTCPACAETEKREVAMTAHTYGDWTKADEDNHKKTCSGCGDVKTEAHAWDKGVVTKEADCKNNGEKTYTCATCKATKTEVIPATGDHVYTNWTKVDDNNHVGTCGCGETKTEAHKWDDGKVTTEPDCKNDGVKTYTCSVCSGTKTEAVPATGKHNYADWVEVDGKHQGTCTGCDGKSELLDHTWNSGVIDPKPTCGAEGEKTFTCTACKATKKEAVPATGEHDFVSDKTSDYVINEDGTHTIKCSGCDETKTDKHEYTQEGTVTVKPTTSSEGKQEWLCVCGDKTEKTLPKASAELDDVAKTGDITGQIVLFTAAVVAMAAAVAYVFKRKAVK